MNYFSPLLPKPATSWALGSGQCLGCLAWLLILFPFAHGQIPSPGQKASDPLATLTLEVEIGTVGIGVALPVVLQTSVDGQLLWLTVCPVSHVMTFTFTLVLALWGEPKR